MRTKEVLSMMRTLLFRTILSSACMLSSIGLAEAQFGRGGAEWMTTGGDAQRSFWIPSDFKISKTALEKPGFQFLWKLKLNNDAVQLNSLTPAVLMDRYIGYRGFRSLAFLGGSSNSLFAVDTDLARIEWQSHQPVPAPPAGSPGCPGGLTANMARPTSVEYPPSGASGGGLGGRGGPARSAVGEAGEGAVTIAAALTAAAPGGPAPNRAPNVRPPAVVYALTGDGMLRTFYISNGQESEPPIQFLPPDSDARGFIVLDNTAYAATKSCNGAASGIRALDLPSREVGNWQPTTGAVAGSAGPAFGPDGTLYVTTTGGVLAALDPKTLRVKQTYTAGSEFSSSPVVFPYKGRNLVAAATRDGRIHLIDSASLGSKALFMTPGYSSSGFEPGALATWQAVDGVRWLLAPASGAPGSGFSPSNGAVTNGAIVAWKVSDRDGAVSLTPGWISRDMRAPLTPMIVNGVVFALSSGEFRPGDARLSPAERARQSSPAVLYALDGATGKVLWDSAKTITSFVHGGGLSGGASQLYLETFDQDLYAFGFPIEH
jgi:outer membrane protein assembly factor BamB